VIWFVAVLKSPWNYFSLSARPSSARRFLSATKYKCLSDTVGSIQSSYSCPGMVSRGEGVRAGRPDDPTMRICMLTTTHLPHDGRIFEKEAKSLAKEHDVTLIAPSDAGGVGEDGGVRVVTVPKPASNLLHPVTLWRTLRACLSQECDVIHCHEPDALLIALLVKAVSGRKVVYDIHEHWPSEIPFDLGLPKATVLTGILESLLSPVEVGLARFADAKIAVSESVAERFRGNGREPVIISNFSVAGSVLPASQMGSGHGVMYMAGNMQLFHGSPGVHQCNVEGDGEVSRSFPDARRERS